MPEEFWGDQCHRVGGCQSWRRPTPGLWVIEQRSVFPGFSVSPCQQTEVHVCVLWPALGAAPSQRLVSGCASRSLLPAQARVH